MKRIAFITILSLITLMLALPAAAQDEYCSGIECAQEVPLYGLPSTVINSYVTPDFRQLEVDQSLLHDRRYVQISGALSVYDAPGGNVVRTIDAGFNFLTILQTREDGWVQINANEWARAESLSASNGVISNFTGIFLPEEPLQYTVAWMLVNAYPSSVPGGDPLESNGMYWRYTLVNIFDTVEVDGFRWYQIGVDRWVHQFNVAKILPIERPDTVTTHRWVGVDLYEQVMIAYEGERPIFASLVSTGLDRWPTFEGTFNIYFRRTRTDMSWGTPGDDFYILEEVPWTMFFDDGRALHGAYWHDGLGYRRSHGCVNISITDAHWLYNWVAQEFDSMNSPDIEVGPNVHVYASDTYH